MSPMKLRRLFTRLPSRLHCRQLSKNRLLRWRKTCFDCRSRFCFHGGGNGHVPSKRYCKLFLQAVRTVQAKHLNACTDTHANARQRNHNANDIAARERPDKCYCDVEPLPIPTLSEGFSCGFRLSKRVRGLLLLPPTLLNRVTRSRHSGLSLLHGSLYRGHFLQRNGDPRVISSVIPLRRHTPFMATTRDLPYRNCLKNNILCKNGVIM